MRFGWTFVLTASLLVGCGKGSMPSGTPQNLKTFDVAETSAESAMTAADAAGAADAASPDEPSAVPMSGPQIAYSYAHGYRLSSGSIGTVQSRHVAMCEKLGTQRCRIMAMNRASSEGDFTQASLGLVVDSGITRKFEDELDAAVDAAGGEVSSRGITAEDLSKQMVDTEARIKAKQALADRLMALLQNRSGKVGELVEAERAFAQAQEELEAARGWMAEMKQRVSMSKIEITYESRTPAGNGLWRPVRDALSTAGQTLGQSLGWLINIFIAILPWASALIGLAWLFRRRGWIKLSRLPWPKRWRRKEPEA